MIKFDTQYNYHNIWKNSKILLKFVSTIIFSIFFDVLLIIYKIYIVDSHSVDKYLMKSDYITKLDDIYKVKKAMVPI